MSEKKSFWSTLPGVLTAIAALITAVSGAIAILIQIDQVRSVKEQPSEYVESQKKEKYDLPEDPVPPSNDVAPTIDYRPVLKNYFQEYYSMRDAWGLDMLNLDKTDDIEDYKSWYARMKKATDQANTPAAVEDLISRIGNKVNSEDLYIVDKLIDKIISMVGQSVDPQPPFADEY